jgi:GDPmannose 4,6-dehydratase
VFIPKLGLAMSEAITQPVSKVALITGIFGQDGSYLCELLLSKGYRVVGTTHRDIAPELASLSNEVQTVKLDLADAAGIERVLLDVRPDEIYHLASRSSSSQLFDDPLAIADVNALTTMRFLEVIRKNLQHAKFCQAGSSEVFAAINYSPQNELSPMCPVNAYGAAKAYARHLVSAYRQEFNLKACTAILFNHESPRRGVQYVTRKITRAVAAISLGQQKELVLGTLDHRRDWGHAIDTVRGLWLMLQMEQPEDIVFATGQTHSIREFCELAFACVQLDYHQYVRITPDLGRRMEKIELCGDNSKAQQALGWQPRISFEQLIREMVDADINQFQNHLKIGIEKGTT